MYLLDTNVLSALRRRERHAHVLGWVSTQRSSDLHVSVISLGEIERGIARTSQRDPRFAALLAEWLDDLIKLYAGRILPIDLRSARRWGRVSQALGHQDADLLIAATALERGLTVVTRNVRHFKPAGVPVLNPFDPR